MPKSVLFVAPRSSDLRIEQELDNVANSGLIVRPYRGGRATRQGLLDLILRREKEPVNLFWFGGHMDKDGIVLEDGVLEDGSLVAIIRAIRPEFVFLNSCASVNLALNIWREIHADVMFSITAVDDLQAYTIGTLYAANLARLDNYSEAYAATRSGARIPYEYLPGRAEIVTGAPVTEDLSLLFYRMDARTSAIERASDSAVNRARTSYILSTICLLVTIITLVILAIHALS